MARLKRDRQYKNKFIAFRVTEEEFNLIKLAASVYTEGNLSEYVCYAAINFEPQYEDLEAPELDELLKSVQNKHLRRGLK